MKEKRREEETREIIWTHQRKGWAHRKEKEVGQSQTEVNRHMKWEIQKKRRKDTSRRQNRLGKGPTVGGKDEAQGKGERLEQSEGTAGHRGQAGASRAETSQESWSGVRPQVRPKSAPQEPSSWGWGPTG